MPITVAMNVFDMCDEVIRGFGKHVGGFITGHDDRIAGALRATKGPVLIEARADVFCRATSASVEPASTGA